MMDNHFERTESGAFTWFPVRSGKILSYTILDSPRSRRLAGMLRIGEDLWRTKDILKYMLSTGDADLSAPHPFLPDDSPLEALFVAAVATYGRCFTSGAAGAILDAKTALAHAAPSLMAYHHEIMTVRNKFVAHAEGMDTLFSYVAWEPATGGQNFQVGVHHGRQPGISKGRLERFLALADAVDAYVTPKLAELHELVEAEVQGNGEALFSCAKNPKEHMPCSTFPLDVEEGMSGDAN